MLEARLASSDGGEQRAHWLSSLAKVCLQLGEPERALNAQVDAFALLPTHEQLFLELESLAHSLRAHEELAAVYEEQLQRVDVHDDVWRLRLWRRLAELYSDVLREPARAALAWEEVCRRSPGEIEPVRALIDAYRRSGDRAALIRTLLDASGWVPAGEDAAMARDALQVAHQLGDANWVEVAESRLLSLVPHDVALRRGQLERALSALQSNRAHQGRLSRVESLLASEAEWMSAEELVSLELTLAVALLETRLLKVNRSVTQRTAFEAESMRGLLLAKGVLEASPLTPSMGLQGSLVRGAAQGHARLGMAWLQIEGSDELDVGAVPSRLPESSGFVGAADSSGRRAFR